VRVSRDTARGLLGLDLAESLVIRKRALDGGMLEKRRQRDARTDGGGADEIVVDPSAGPSAWVEVVCGARQEERRAREVLPAPSGGKSTNRATRKI
jgi:hypothetical protein